MCDKLKKIEMGKKYTYLGQPARVICVDRNHKHYPVVALVSAGGPPDDLFEELLTFSALGEAFKDSPGTERLVEVSPYADWKIDDKILVTNNLTVDTRWYRRYFAGICSDGRVSAFADGATSWSAKDITGWNHAKKEEPSK